MKKLNSKGMSTVEILVCFVLVVIITVSMYSTVTAYRNKQQVESFKEKIMTYKSLLTKEIQDDLIKKGLIAAKVIENSEGEHSYRYTTTVNLTFRDGSTKNLIINRKIARDYDYSVENGDDPLWENNEDYFNIKYGPAGSEIEYPIPNLGYGENEFGKKVLDLRIQNIMVNTDDNILTIKIEFYHVDLPSRYGIDIVCPINYSSTEDISST